MAEVGTDVQSASLRRDSRENKSPKQHEASASAEMSADHENGSLIFDQPPCSGRFVGRSRLERLVDWKGSEDRRHLFLRYCSCRIVKIGR